MRHIEPLEVEDLRNRLISHPLYAEVSDVPSLLTFMGYHVFCVWDFQSLLKALQAQLTCVSLPWLPTAEHESRRMINEIVLEEESGVHPDGGYTSHFEFYLEAMVEAGADTRPIEQVLEGLRQGAKLQDVMAAENMPSAVQDFVYDTFEAINSGRLPRIVSIFTHAREDLIPEMFRGLVGSLAHSRPHQWRKYVHYLNRHIELDGERHGPISHALLRRVCGGDATLWREAEHAARQALEARLRLWDHILEEIRKPS